MTITEPLPRVLGDLAARAATGRLEIVAGSVRREIFLKKGVITQAYSRSMKEALGRVLLDQGWVSETALDEALHLAAADKRQLGEVLISQGVLSPTQVVEALTEQVRLRCFNTFRLRDYEMNFEEGALSPAAFQVRLKVAVLVVEGVALALSIDRILDELALTEDAIVTATKSSADIAERLSLAPRELRLLQQTQGGTTVEKLLEQGEHAYLKLLRFLFSLWVLRLVRVDAAPGLEMTARPSALPDQSRGATLRAPDSAKEAKVSDAAKATPDEGEGGAAQSAPTKRKKKRKKKNLASVQLEVEDPHDPARAQLRRRLIDRYRKRSRAPTPTAVPIQPKQPRRLTPVRAVPAPLGEGGLAGEVITAFLRLPRQDYFALLDVGVRSSGPEISAAYGALIRRYRLEQIPEDWSARAKRAATDLHDRAIEAITVLSDPVKRSLYLKQRAAGGSLTFEGDGALLRAGVALHKARRLRERGALAEAEEVLREVLELAPDQAALWLRLGELLVDRLQAGELELQEEAVTALRKAAALDPALALPWIMIGRVAEARGEADLAAKLYRKALSVDPRSERARAGLSQLEKKSKKGSLLDKLLGRS